MTHPSTLDVDSGWSTAPEALFSIRPTGGPWHAFSWHAIQDAQHLPGSGELTLIVSGVGVFVVQGPGIPRLYDLIRQQGATRVESDNDQVTEIDFTAPPSRGG